ncbi:hypothetical protein SAY86_027809 [Trapa natans]|uniref:DUF985 domain-containing protein n=1 Tax=Trapa natans TaxID=22666 RepID=A0AAN7KMU3_TRANT|nr:hypothetical protein SAY86_027809 [Trapa natans]
MVRFIILYIFLPNSIFVDLAFCFFGELLNVSTKKMSPPTTSKIVEKLNLTPHPEGGFYSETLRDSSVVLSTSQLPSRYKVNRPVSTSIYFLMPSGNVSLLHRIPMAETWHFTWENLSLSLS